MARFFDLHRNVFYAFFYPELNLCSAGEVDTEKGRVYSLYPAQVYFAQVYFTQVYFAQVYFAQLYFGQIYSALVYFAQV